MALKQLGLVISLVAVFAPACSGADASDPVATESEPLARVCVQNVLCIAGDHFDPIKCRCVPNCVDNVLCIAGSHWDSTLCKCMPDAPKQCVSGPGGPCGGFTQSPCICGPGTKCVPNRIPDIPGVCAVCDPVPCPSGEHWDRASCQCVAGCTTAADCHGILPALCRVCADGSDGCAHFECVNNACQIAYCQ